MDSATNAPGTGEVIERAADKACADRDARHQRLLERVQHHADELADALGELIQAKGFHKKSHVAVSAYGKAEVTIYERVEITSPIVRTIWVDEDGNSLLRHCHIGANPGEVIEAILDELARRR